MTVEVSILGRRLRYRPLTVETPDGVRIAVQDHGRAAGGHEILFLHGFSQSSLSWLKQVGGQLAERYRLVTYDLRGHGASDKPEDPAFYRDPVRWANEVRAVIEATGLSRPIIVSWSYSGRVVLDYLREHGSDAISGLVNVASTSTAHPDVLGPATPNLRAMATARDLAENVVATQALLEACVAQPLPADEHELMLAYNLLVPPAVRLAMGGREADYDAVLRALTVPVLAIHGAKDAINRVAMSEHTVAQAPNASQLIYQQSGHMPFWEEAQRFDADLSAFVDALAADGKQAPPGAASMI